MNYREEKRSVAREFAEEKLSSEDFYLVSLGGSVGDKYGYVHKNSDIDIAVWTEGPYFDREPVLDWEPYDFKAQRKWDMWFYSCLENKIVTSKFRVDLIENVKGNKVGVAFLEFRQDIYEVIKSDLENKELSNFDFLVTVIYAEPLRDEFGLHKELSELTKDLFSEKRASLAEEALRVMRLPAYKIDDDLDDVKHSGKIDTLNYNAKAKEIIDIVAFVKCCTKNIPMSLEFLRIKRNQELWKTLDMDIDLIKETQVKNGTLDEVRKSREILKNEVRKVYEEAKKEFPGLDIKEHWLR